MRKLVACLLASLLALSFRSCFQILPIDLCDEDPMGNVDFISFYSGLLNLYYLPGTAAERDREDIL